MGAGFLLQGALGFDFENEAWLESGMPVCVFLPAVAESISRPFHHPNLIKAPFIQPAALPNRLSASQLVAMAETEGRSCPPGTPGIQLRRAKCRPGDVCPAGLTVGHGAGRGGAQRLGLPEIPVKWLSNAFLKRTLSAPWRFPAAPEPGLYHL